MEVISIMWAWIRYRLGSFVWVWEAATGGKGYALLNRLKYNLSSDYHLLLVHRYYSYDYWTLFGRSFGESSMPQNENGWYLAAEVTPFARWKFFTSLDVFSFSWWKYRISKPSKGVDAMFQVTYTPRKSLSMYFNYRYKQKERDVTKYKPLQLSDLSITINSRYRLTYMPGRYLFHATIDYNHFRQPRMGKGIALIDSKVISVLNFARTLSLPSVPVSVREPGFIRTITIRVFTPPSVELLYTFYTPFLLWQGFRYSRSSAI